MEEMAVVDVSEERRRRRRAGDPRLSAAGQEVLARITTGDLAEECRRSRYPAAQRSSNPPLGPGHSFYSIASPCAR